MKVRTRLGDLGRVLDSTFKWDCSVEGQDYWAEAATRWREVKNKQLLDILWSLADPRILSSEMEFDELWPDPTEVPDLPLYKKLQRLARYHDRFGKDAPIPLMIELVKEQ